MYSEKKITKEDTWRTDDLLKHMQGRRNDEGTGNKQDYLGTEDIRKARRGESADRRQRGQERITHWETDGSGERTRHKDKERDRERDGTQERTRHKDKERDRERDGTREKTRHKDKERDRERDGTRERTRHKDKERERERDGTRERTRHRDKEKDREQDGTRERTRHRDKERDREQDGTREKTRHRDKERDREQDGTRDRTRHRDKEKDREQDGTQERPKHRDKERDRDQDRMRDSRREIDERKQEKRKEWEILEKIEYNKESRDSRQERSEKEDRERERMRDERDREHGIKRDRKRAEERGGDRHREKEQERWKEKDGYRDRERGHSSKHVKESNQSKEEVQDPHTEQRARHREREHSRQKEDKEYREQRRREKEEKGRRQREREQWESVESWRDDEDSRDGGKVGRDVEQRDGGRKERVRHRDSRHVEVKHSDEALSQETFGNRKRWTQEDSEKPNEGRRQLKVEGKPEDAEVNVVSPENLGQEDAEEYEEDFEDYEEDFEEAEQSDEAKEDEAGGGDGGGDGRAMSPRLRKEVEAIQRAMEAENRRLGPIQSMSWTGEQEAAGRDATADGVILHNRASKQGKFINFVAAKRREISKKIADKQKKRSVELLRLIDLDFSVTFSLLDLPPLTEYDMYIKSFGSTNTKQAYVQCNEDNTDRDVQTEDIETNDRWTQHPGDRGFSCGGPGLTSETSDEQGGGLSTGSPRLSAFLLSAAQVITVLLEEDRAKRLSLKRPVLQGGTLSCCDGSLQLSSAVPFLRGREVGLVLFSQAHRQTMLSVHRSSARPSPIDLDSKTILCIWNIWEPSYPQKILVYESEVCCCCFGPGNASLVFAGTAVGSLVLWDLREPSSQHSSIRIGEQDWTLRYPTFSTDAVLVTSAHLCPVTSVELIPPSAAEAQRTSFPVVPWQEESSGLSFQLGSLDEKGVLNLWVVVELRRGDDAGSHVDLGLKPGGKVKLLHSSSVSLLQQSFPAEALTLGSVQTLLLKFHPSDSSHFFVGTNMSLVYHGTRHSLRSTPTFYRAHKAGLSPAQVTSLEFSPFSEPVFLVGCDDGSVRLHSVPSESPVAQWCCGAGGSVVSAHWSLTRPAVFCTLDVAASVIHVWDLLQKDSEPVVTEKVHPDHAATMAVFGDPSKQSSFSGISLATQSGKLEIHYFSRSWAVPGRGEREWLQTLASDVY